MTKTEKYTSAISKFLLDFEEKFKDADDSLKTVTILDKERGHFQSLVHGFQNDRFVFIVQFHFDIIGDKVWVLKNSTDVELEEVLNSIGIPNSDIVIGFLPEYERAFSRFGIDEEVVI
jgi:hypothetical protein